jgi:CDK-activating kinase assembly factor MAT1
MRAPIVSSSILSLCLSVALRLAHSLTNAYVCICMFVCICVYSCHACVDREMARKREFPCPVCRTAVKRVTLTQRTLDDVQCEKDTSWRRRVLKVFNKTRLDFDTLLDYNNYLEKVEDMLYSIVNEEPNAEECKARIKDYEQAHKADIVIRQSQRADFERSIQDRIASEQRQAEQLRQLVKQEEKAVALAKRKWKQESTEVLLGEREEVSAESRAAQMQGYRNELKRQARGGAAPALLISPRVREPVGGWKQPAVMDQDFYRKRQAAGGGIPTGSIASHERNWNETLETLFSRMQ